ncbi:hypothetical protein MHB84_05115 [Paenibacillus sp. FSL F4-0087]|uniref:hypothetical protein n=1 Tax=unclassified Paenibacillus TaxID=185978 RepID=UPI00096C60DA|nr:hypothetical protein BK122_17470 [Paenibacillus pabuli]
MNFLQMNYCEHCETKECEFPEVSLFMEWLQTKEGVKYEHHDCPDKVIKNLVTADFQFKNTVSNELLTIEVKQLHHAFSQKKVKEEKNIALSKGRDLINGAFEQVTNIIDRKLYDYIKDNFIVHMPMAIVSEKESQKIGEELLSFFRTENLNLYNGNFIYEKKRNKEIKRIEIKFQPLTDEIRQLGGKGIYQLFPVDPNEMAGISFSEIWETTWDVSHLTKKVIKNLIKSNNSFIEINENRIMLQVIVFKYGLDLNLMNIDYFNHFIFVLKEEMNKHKSEFKKHEFNFDNAYICLLVDGVDNTKNFEVLDITKLL